SDATLTDLKEDAERLAEAWRPVLAKRQAATAPATLYHDLDPVERTLRDMVRADTVRVLMDDPASVEAAKAYCRRTMPEAESKIEVFTGPGALFAPYDLEDEIDKLPTPRVPLPSGGWITIESTEALTAVDVNSGSFTAATGLEETGARVNLEAADEIGRQVRLRGIGGLSVCAIIAARAKDNIPKRADTLPCTMS